VTPGIAAAIITKPQATVTLDLVVDPNLSLFAVYLIPTLFAAWFLGYRWAYASCAAGAAVWWFEDWEEMLLHHHPLISYLNLAEKFVVTVVVVAIVIALKLALENEHQAERRSVQREFEIAQEVQRGLLPAQTPSYPPLDFAFLYRPAKEVGGDYYDFIPFDAAHVGFAVGDVSGKGLPSALLMATLQGLVRMILLSRHSELDQFATELNRSLFSLTASNRYATLFFASVDLTSRTLCYINAGQNPPLLFRGAAQRADGVTMPAMLNDGGPPAGLLPASTYRSQRMALTDGDVLVAYTDGVVDALNSQQEEFGEDRLIGAVHSVRHGTAAEICRQIDARLRSFVGQSAQFDDITLVVMKIDSR